MLIGMFSQHPPPACCRYLHGEFRLPPQPGNERVQFAGIAVNQNLPVRFETQRQIRQIVIQYHCTARQRFKTTLVQTMLHIRLIADIQHRLMTLIQPDQCTATDLAILHVMKSFTC